MTTLNELSRAASPAGVVTEFFDRLPCARTLRA